MKLRTGIPYFWCGSMDTSPSLTRAPCSWRSIDLASRDPHGGHIDRNENGEPTGILRETAQDAVIAVIPKATHDQLRQGLELALADLAEHGVTSAQDYSPNWENFEIYEELEREGKLTARISEWLPFDDPIEELSRKLNSHPQSDLMLHTGMLKGFMDGSLGSHTAAMLEPYSDDPKNSGIPRYDPVKLNDMTKERVRGRLPGRLSRHRRQRRADGARCLCAGRKSRA